MPPKPDKPKREKTSPHFKPAKMGKQRHFSCADTTDSADVIDRIEYQVSEDGGATWRLLAFVTGAEVGTWKDDPPGVVRQPGMVVKHDRDSRGYWPSGTPEKNRKDARALAYPNAIFRTVISHGTGKDLASRCEDLP